MVNVERILEDNWSGVTSVNVESACHSVEQALESVRRLNGENRTIVILRGRNGVSLTIGGGNDGCYIAYADADDAFQTLANTEASESETALIVAGGQEGEYPARQCVGLDLVLEACRDFVETGRLSNRLTWDVL